MRSTKFRSLFTLALVAGLVSGCTEGSEAPVVESSTSEAPASPLEELAEPDEPTPTRYEFAPSGESLVIEAVESIAGTEPYESDGISIQVPKSMRVERTELDEHLTVFAIFDPERERALVTFTVSDREKATDAAVDQASVAFETKIGAAGAHSMSRVPATWSTWPYAVATRLTLPLGDDANPPEVEAISVALRNAKGGTYVSVTAEAAPGELQESLAFEILRTLRPAA